jgi:DNA mismatch repair protein MutS
VGKLECRRWAIFLPSDPLKTLPQRSPAKKRPEQTPMMRQFWAAKKKHPDALLFFRMGDFYEMFGDDAILASKKLGITLTSRSKEKDQPMAGVPVRSMEGYLVRLVRMGHTVAICEQMQDPREVKGIVDRDVVRVVSPGTLIDDEGLEGNQPLFVLSVHIEAPQGRGKNEIPTDDLVVGLAWADISTGCFRCSSTTIGRFSEELARIQPAEVLYPDLAESDFLAEPMAGLIALVEREEIATTRRAPWSFDAQRGRRDLCEQLQVKTLDAFGLEDSAELLAAGSGLLEFLRDTQKNALEQIRDLKIHRPSEHLVLDLATRRTLEITRSQHDGSRSGTVLSVLDCSETPMGARLLRDWLLEPLVIANAIQNRHDAVETLYQHGDLRRQLRSALHGLGDLERLAAKVATSRAGGREFVALASALERVPALRQLLTELGKTTLAENLPPRLADLLQALDPCVELTTAIRKTLVDHPPLGLKDGDLIRDGFDSELDELRALARGGKEYLAALQVREMQRTGISTLKLGFNRVFGYYIEVSAGQASQVPDDYIRKQTLKNAERYITPELKEYEGKVLGAEEKSKDLEYRLFVELREAATAQTERLLRCAQAIAELDVYASLAEVAVQRRYVRPELVESESGAVLDICSGRHPVVEASLLEDPFVPNDTSLGGGTEPLAILTGPNMSGKSTYLRQTALIVLLAQMGSFVPADSARLSLVDRIFTRLGGADDISRGASTFMVEMVETANILRNASEHSLLLLDEVGRGTSTFDGLAIAWAVCEYVHDRLAARCLFATHYHQLTDLANDLARARNLNVAVREWGQQIVFLHRIDEGGTDRSYGIHVGRLAGLPAAVLERAEQVLGRLERQEEDLSHRILDRGAPRSAPQSAEDAGLSDREAAGEMRQNSLFDLFSASGQADLIEEIRQLELDHLTPIEAWQWMKRIRKAVDQD